MFARQRYVWSMMKAINLARTIFRLDDKYIESKTDGLRVIRRFEKTNGIKFNPKDNSHLGRISGMADHEKFFRRISYIKQPSSLGPADPE